MAIVGGDVQAIRRDVGAVQIGIDDAVGIGAVAVIAALEMGIAGGELEPPQRRLYAQVDLQPFDLDSLALHGEDTVALRDQNLALVAG